MLNPESSKQHCCLCGRWIVDSTALTRHIRGAHKEVWNKHEQHLKPECTTAKHFLKRSGMSVLWESGIYQTLFPVLRDFSKRPCSDFAIMTQATAANELTNMFGHLMPSLAASSQSQAQLGKRTSSPSGGLNKRQTQGRRAGQRGHKKTEDTEEIISLMARVIINQKDQLGLSRVDRAFTMFMEQSGPTGVLSNLYQGGVAWNHKLEDRSLGKNPQPLRTTLLTLMIMELVSRLEALKEARQSPVPKARVAGRERQTAVSSLGPGKEDPGGIKRSRSLPHPSDHPSPEGDHSMNQAGSTHFSSLLHSAKLLSLPCRWQVSLRSHKEEPSVAG